MFCRRVFSIAITAILLLLPAALQADWPQFRGPTGLGYTTAKKLPVTWGGKENANVRWSAPLKGEGHASPVVVGNRVIVCNVSWPVKTPKEMPKHFVTAYDLAKGDELWSTEIEPGPWLRDDFRSGPGGGYACPTPCIAKDHIHVLFGSAVLAVLDLNGKVVKRQTIEPYTFDVTIGSSLITNGERMLLLCGMAKKQDSKLVSLAPVTAEVQWERKLPKVGFAHSSPIITPGENPQAIIVASGGGETDDAAQGFDLASGEPLWNCRGAGEASSPALSGKIMYFDSGRGSKGTAVDITGKGDVTGTHIQWTVGAVTESIGSPIIVGDYVYRLHGNNVLKCWKLSDGTQMYSERVGGDVSSTWASPIADAEGRIFLASGGKSIVFKSGEKFELLGKSDLGDANHASPAVAGERLLIVGQKKLWCIGAE